MTANGFQSQLSTYASGAALGVLALIAVLGPHVRLDGFAPARPAAACAARMSSDQVEALRGEVIRAEAWRASLIGGGSRYAAAKTGVVDIAALAEADHALHQARARFLAVCG